MFVKLLLAGGGFVWYYNDTQERLAILQENNAPEVAVQSNEEALKQQKLAFETMQAENRKLNIEFLINERNKALENRLSRHDIGKIAVAKTNEKY